MAWLILPIGTRGDEQQSWSTRNILVNRIALTCRTLWTLAAPKDGCVPASLRRCVTLSTEQETLAQFKDWWVALRSHCPGHFPDVDSLVHQIGPLCPNLASLDLSGAHSLTPNSMANLVDHCRGLTALNLSGCSSLTEASIVRVAECCPDLVALTLSLFRTLPDAAVTRIAQCCPLLEYLDVGCCDALSYGTDPSVRSMCKSACILGHRMLPWTDIQNT